MEAEPEGPTGAGKENPGFSASKAKEEAKGGDEAEEVAVGHGPDTTFNSTSVEITAAAAS